MPKSNKSRFAILGILAIAPNSSGYDIKKLMESSTQYFWKETFSSIYPVLQELETAGCLAKQEIGSKNKRQRHTYSLTEKGHEELRMWLGKPVEFEQFRNELLLKLFFGETVPLLISKKHIEEYQNLLIKKQNTYQHIRETLLEEQQKAKGLPFWLMTLEFGFGQIQAALEWCKKALKEINILEKDTSHV